MLQQHMLLWHEPSLSATCPECGIRVATLRDASSLPEAQANHQEAMLAAAGVIIPRRMHDHWETTGDTEALRDALRWQGQVNRALEERNAELILQRRAGWATESPHWQEGGRD